MIAMFSIVARDVQAELAEGKRAAQADPIGAKPIIKKFKAGDASAGSQEVNLSTKTVLEQVVGMPNVHMCGAVIVEVSDEAFEIAKKNGCDITMEAFKLLPGVYWSVDVVNGMQCFKQHFVDGPNNAQLLLF